MSQEWIATLVGRMHVCKVTKKRLADEAGMTPEYLSMILNGHRYPAGAEEKLTAALDRLIKNQDTANTAP